MPKLTIGGKEYTLRTPQGKEFMSLMSAERAGNLEARVTKLETEWATALQSGELGDTEAKLKEAWLQFCRAIFIEPVEELDLDNLSDGEVFEIKGFFLRAWVGATPELRKRLDAFEASKVKVSSSPDLSPAATS